MSIDIGGGREWQNFPPAVEPQMGTPLLIRYPVEYATGQSGKTGIRWGYLTHCWGRQSLHHVDIPSNAEYLELPTAPAAKKAPVLKKWLARIRLGTEEERTKAFRVYQDGCTFIPGQSFVYVEAVDWEDAEIKVKAVVRQDWKFPWDYELVSIEEYTEDWEQIRRT